MRKGYNSRHKLESKILTYQELLDLIKEITNAYTRLSTFYIDYLGSEIDKAEKL